MAGGSASAHIMDMSDTTYVARTTCSICMDTDGDSPWVALPCGHLHHLLCWEQARGLVPKPSCPTCKAVPGKKDVAGLRLYNVENVPVKELAYSLMKDLRISGTGGAQATSGGSRSESSPSAAQLKSEVQRVQNKLNMSEAASKEWRAKADSLEEELLLAVDQQQKLTKKVQKLRNEALETTVEIGKLQDMLFQKEAEIQRLRADMNALRENKEIRIRHLEEKLKQEEKVKVNLQREVESAQFRVRQQERAQLMHKMSHQSLSESDTRRMLSLDGQPGAVDLQVAVEAVQLRDRQLQRLQQELDRERAARRELSAKAALDLSSETRRHDEEVERLKAECNKQRKKALRLENDVMTLREELAESKPQQTQQPTLLQTAWHSPSQGALLISHHRAPTPSNCQPPLSLALSEPQLPSQPLSQAQSVPATANQPADGLDSPLAIMELDDSPLDKENTPLDILDDSVGDLWVPRLPGGMGLLSKGLGARATATVDARMSTATVTQSAQPVTSGVRKRTGPQETIAGSVKKPQLQGPCQESSGRGAAGGQESSFLGKAAGSTMLGGLGRPGGGRGGPQGNRMSTNQNMPIITSLTNNTTAKPLSSLAQLSTSHVGMGMATNSKAAGRGSKKAGGGNQDNQMKMTCFLAKAT